MGYLYPRLYIYIQYPHLYMGSKVKGLYFGYIYIYAIFPFVYGIKGKWLIPWLNMQYPHLYIIYKYTVFIRTRSHRSWSYCRIIYKLQKTVYSKVRDPLSKWMKNPRLYIYISNIPFCIDEIWVIYGLQTTDRIGGMSKQFTQKKYNPMDPWPLSEKVEKTLQSHFLSEGA